MVIAGPPRESAARAGIKAGTTGADRESDRYIGGDVITGVDGQPVRTRDDLDRILGAKKLGDRVQVDVVRGRRPRGDPVRAHRAAREPWINLKLAQRHRENSEFSVPCGYFLVTCP